MPLTACLFTLGCQACTAGRTSLAVTQIMVYIGGILVLMIFGIMLTEQGEKKPAQNAMLFSFK
jgi:NADH:ubiquinone oxidoreductase subunit 6 (subunit J)